MPLVEWRRGLRFFKFFIFMDSCLLVITLNLNDMGVIRWYFFINRALLHWSRFRPLRLVDLVSRVLFRVLAQIRVGPFSHEL